MYSNRTSAVREGLQGCFLTDNCFFVVNDQKADFHGYKLMFL